LAGLAGAPLLAGGLFACGSSASVGASTAKSSGGVPANEVLKHEDCTESGNKVESLDTNGDGKPDIRKVFNKSGRLMCSIVDLNHDGKIDMYEYYDDGGNVRRREFCYDDTGQVNAIEYYDAGKLSHREYDTMGMHKIDTWDYFDGSSPTDAKTGRPTHPARRERDVTGDGHIDQWWTWSGDNVTIAVDNNGDGKPDPESVITLDKKGQPVDTSNPPPPPPPAASSAAAPASTDSAAAAASASPASSASSAPAPAAAPTTDGGH
jgi:hypothetical protein